MSHAMVSRAAIAKRGEQIPGYEAEVMQCVTRSTDTHVFIPRPEYDRLRQKYGAPPPGPGTELKALLKRVGIVASPGCSCNTRAKLMDANELKEPGWCESNLDTICDWLQEEATKRKLPFLRMAGKILVRKAIRNARKKGQ
jgi:hypothetical protein